MTRAAFATVALVVLALVTVVASAAFDSRAGDEAWQGGAYAVASVGTIPADWVRVEWYQDAGGGLHAVLAATAVQPTATPTLTPTPLPSVTPIPTNTARPSATPTATSTVTPTNTPPVEPSPTPEAGTPIPSTPRPTPEPPDYGCQATVNVDWLNVRATPGTGSAASGSLRIDSRVWVLKVAYVGNDVWLNIRASAELEGWSAGYYQGTDYITLDNSEACDFARWGTEQPTLSRGVGWTATIGASADTLNQAAAYLRAGGYTPALTVAAETNSIPTLLAGGWVINWRPFYDIGAGDCGDKTALPAEAAAWARVEALAPYVEGKLAAWGVRGTKRVIIQLENECWHPSATYANAWISAAAAYCTARGWTCIPAVWATGNPDAAWLTTLEPAMQALAARGHFWGMNVGPYKPELMLCEDTAGWTQYTTWYGRMIRDHAPASMQIWVTESARGNAEQSVDLADYLCFLPKALKVYSTVDMWYYGGLPLGNWVLSRWTREQVLDYARALAG